ncbi:4852_t:CDS:1 [Funneliformis caledonium]|uniref:4852_t:CDS:1 n=1 Tax=Funneliformis caledonium TaxID=1117310 RepID=A0A9N9EL76_9GLOM|nr:4852_t:CDS:1 [Funneliformis caledonium]
MPPLSKAKRAAKQHARKKGGEFTLRTDKEILEEMLHELEGSEEGMLNKSKDGNEKEILNKPGGEGDEKMLNIFEDDKDLWGDKEDSGWESESNVKIEEKIKN